ncbi:hypothetical protein GCM10009727_47830 [Actinomadura napierensis]|uniref:Uncharacterized protein n=1 Tax=Actinomadura napierensis TaxID=267854 RepID=A0ABP5LFU2_9ACTN
MFVWWGGAGVRGRPSKVKGAFGVASRWTSSTLDFGASAAPEAALRGRLRLPRPGRATPPPTHVRVFTNPHKTTIDTFLQSVEIKGGRADICRSRRVCFTYAISDGRP